MALTVAELRAVMNLDATPFQRGLSRMGADAQRQFGGLDSRVRRTNGFLRQAAATMTGFLGAQVVMSGVRRGFEFAKDAVFGFNDQLDRSETAFTTMLGSGRRARLFLDDLKRFAIATPFEFPELVRNAQKLMAMGFAAKDVLPTLEAVGDATAGLGGDPGTMNQIIRALGQMQAKGKVMSGEMTQLAEAGVGAWQMLADEIGVSVPKAMEMVEKGQIRSAQAVPALVRGMNREFGGLMDAQSKTWQGALSNIKDAATQAIANGLRPAFDKAKAAAVGLAAWLSQGNLERYIQRIGDALTGETASGIFRQIGTAAANLWEVVKPLAISFGGMLLDAMTELGNVAETVLLPALVALTGWMKEHPTLIGTVTAAVLAGVAAWKAYMIVLKVIALVKALRVAFLILNAVMRANPIGLVVTALAALVGALVYAYQHSETFRRIVHKALHGVAAAARFMWDSGKVALALFRAGLRKIGDMAIWLWNKAIAPAFEFIIHGIGRLLLMWGKMLRGLAKVPGFGWAEAAGRKMEHAGQKAIGLRLQISRIKGKSVKVNVDTRTAQQRARDLYNTLLAISGRSYSATVTVNTSGGGGIRRLLGQTTGNAIGTSFASGRGWTRVGEYGPELVKLPRGAQVFTAPQSRMMEERAWRTGGGRPVNVQVNFPATATPEAAWDAAGGRILAALDAGGIT